VSDHELVGGTYTQPEEQEIAGFKAGAGRAHHTAHARPSTGILSHHDGGDARENTEEIRRENTETEPEDKKR